MSNEAPTDALRLVPETGWTVGQTLSQLDQEAERDGLPIGTINRLKLAAATIRSLAAAPASPLSGGGLPADVVRLVIAARMVAFDRVSAATIAELDAASEAFASRVPWDNAPDELPAAPTGDA